MSRSTHKRLAEYLPLLFLSLHLKKTTAMEESTRLSGYDLSRQWFDFCFENPDLIKPNHTALYFFAIEHCNRLGWKSKFGFPTSMAMEALGIKSYNTFKNTLEDLVAWGFVLMVERSKNQYSANIIALSNNNKALDKALDKALIKHASKQSESTSESIDSIDKQETIEQLTINNEQSEQVAKTSKRFVPPTFQETKEYFLEKKWGAKIQFDEIEQAERFLDFYMSKGWVVGKVSMKDWRAAIRNWIKGIKPEYNGKQQTTIDRRDQSKQDTSDAVARHYAERLASEKGGTGI